MNKGITVVICGDTTKLDKALKGVNSSLTKTQSLYGGMSVLTCMLAGIAIVLRKKFN